MIWRLLDKLGGATARWKTYRDTISLRLEMPPEENKDETLTFNSMILSADGMKTKMRHLLIVHYLNVKKTKYTFFYEDGWQNWESTISSGFNLETGVQWIQIRALSHEFNLNWFALSTKPDDFITSTTSLEDDREIVIYLNSFDKEELFIRLNEGISSAEIQIHIIDGKILFQKEYQNINDQISINDLNFNTGLYILTITGEGFSTHHKIIAK